MLPLTASRRSSSSRPPGRSSAFQSRTTSEIASTTSSPSPRTAASRKSAIGSGLNAAWPPASTIGSSSPRSHGVHRDAGEVERVEHVGVAELGREAQAEHVEGTHRAVAVDGELRDVVLAHHLLHVGPHGVGALGHDPVALVEHFVEDLHALVGQADLVGVGVHQRPADGRAVLGAVPVLDRRVELAADVLDRLLHGRQLRLQAREDRCNGHDGNTSGWMGSEERLPSVRRTGAGRRLRGVP